MAKYVAFLRGMNLGRRRIKNDELRAAFESLGLAGVTTFLASGNVIFTTPSRALRAIATKIEAGLESTLEYAVPTFLRTAAEVRAIAAQNPFPDAAAGKLQVALLHKRPTAQSQTDVARYSTKEDQLRVHGRELYWQPSGNLTDSALDLKAIENLLGAMTVRTKRTIDRIATGHLDR